MLERSSGIEHAIILKHLRDAELPARVQLHAGDMDVVIGAPSDVEVLPGDLMQVSGSLRNVYFGARPSLEVSLFLLRLVCTNGAYALRQVAGGRLASWSTIRQARAFLDQQLGRIASFHGGALQGAVQRMSDDLVEPEEHQRVELLLSRLAGAERARNLMSDAVSSYDVLNAITSGGQPGRRKGQATAASGSRRRVSGALPGPCEPVRRKPGATPQLLIARVSQIA